MGARTTTAGKIKIGIALDPDAYELLQQMASGPRGLGHCLEDLIRAEAARRAVGQEPEPDAQQRRVEELQAVTERLREAEASARDLIRYAPTAIYEVDFRTGRFLNVNEAMCDMLGYTRDELLAMSAFDIMDETNRARLAERQRLALAGKDVEPSFEYEVKRKDGRVVYGALNTRVVYRDGLPVGAQVIAHDVTESRRAADELRDQRERLARLAAEQTAVLEAIADGLVIYDRAGQVAHMNRAAEDIVSSQFEDPRPIVGELAGRLHARLPNGQIYPPSRYPARRALQGETVQGDVMVLQRPDETLWIACSAAPIMGPDGSLRGAVATFTDITALREAQARLEETYQELEATHEELQAQAEELAVANVRLAQERDHLAALEKELRVQQEQSAGLAAELDAILSSIADGLVVYDSQGRITRMNSLAEELLGFSPQVRQMPYEQRVPSAAVGLHADGTPYARHEYPTVRALQGEVVRHEELIMCLPRRPIEASWVSVSSGPIRRQGGSVAGAVTTFTDVSRVHRLNEQLGRANAQLEAILAAVPSGLIVYDAAGKTVRASEAARRMVGWSSESWRRPASERAGANVRFLDINGRYLSRDEYPALRALRGETLSSEEYYTRFPDNPEHDIWAVFAAGPIHAEDGQVVGALVTWTDTSKLHEANQQLIRANAQLEVQAEELRHAAELLEERVRQRTAALEESEQKFLTAFNLNPTALAISSIEGRYIEVNQTFCDLLGYSRAELIGKTSRELGLVVPQTHRKVIETIATSGGGLAYEIDARARNGQVLHFISYVQTVTLHGIPHYIVANVDITERKRAEALIAAHAEQLREQAELLDLSHDAILVRGLDGAIGFWNRGATEMYGWRSAEAAGRTSHELLRTEFPQPMDEIIAEVTERDRWEGELIHTTKDGAALCVASRWALKRDPSGRPLAILQIDSDLSRQKAAEAQRAAVQRAILQQSQRLELLHEIDRSILAARAPAEIALAAIDKLRKAMVAQRATVVLTDFVSGTGEVLTAVGPESREFRAGARTPLTEYPFIERVQAGEVVILEDMAKLSEAALPSRDSALRAGLHSAALLPLVAGKEVIGLLSVSLAVPGRLPPESLEMASHVADSLAVAIHNARLHEQLQASHAQLAQREATLQTLSRRLVEQQERERSYVADRLYNEAAQVIAALKMQAGVMQRSAKQEPAASQWLHDLADMMDRALVELHRLATDLRPAVLDRLGLVAAVQQYAVEFGAKHGLAVDVEAQGLKGVRLPAEIETCAYRVLQEALANAGQHAGATRVEVGLRRADGKLLLQVCDNGTGFDVQQAVNRGAVGLVGMRERAEAVRGVLSIASAPGSGTTVILEIPGTSAAGQS